MSHRTKVGLVLLSLLGVGFALGWVASVARYGLRIGPRHGPPGPPPPEVWAKVGLSPDQKEALDRIHEEGREKREALFEAERKVRREFERLMDSTKEPQALRGGYRALLDAKRALEWDHFETMLEVNGVLSLEQIRRLRRLHRPPGPPPRPR